MSAPSPRRSLILVPVVIAGLGAVLAAQVVGRDPRYFVPVLAFVALLSAPPLLGRYRMKKLLISGDVERVIGTWEGSIDGVPHRETMAPLLRATAYAAYGWLEAARRALDRAVRGPAWDAALEQRLFIEMLLDTFEGDREGAVRKAGMLQALPAPAAGLLARRRIALLRQGLAALARAFAHTSHDDDARLLAKAAGASPLVHWAMRYGAAIVAVDSGRAGDVALLLSGAPPWPQESAFRAYHDELLERARGLAPEGVGAAPG